MAEFNLKKNDTNKTITFQLKHEEDGTTSPIDLTDSSVKFYMRKKGETDKKVDGGNCVITDYDNAYVSYAWGTNDLDTPGLYEAELVVTYSTGKTETFPETSENVAILVEDNL